jgi:hypothetical protein
VIRIPTNKTTSQLAITVVGESYRIVEIRSLTWSYLIIPVCHHVRSNQKLGYLSSSVRRLYLVDRRCLLLFLFWLSIKYLFFQINVMDPFWHRSLAFACIMTRISTPSAPNIHPGGRNGSSCFPLPARPHESSESPPKYPSESSRVDPDTLQTHLAFQSVFLPGNCRNTG